MGRAVAESVREGGEEVGKTAEAVGKVAGRGWWPWETLRPTLSPSATPFNLTSSTTRGT